MLTDTQLRAIAEAARLTERLRELIDEIKQDRIDDANSAEDSGERPDLWGYEVCLDLDYAEALLSRLAALEAEQAAGEARVVELEDALTEIRDYPYGTAEAASDMRSIAVDAVPRASLAKQEPGS